MDNNAINMINKIWEMSGDSLADKILDYCETYDQDEREVGEILAQSADFKKMLYKDCLKNHIIKDDDMKKHLGKTEAIEAW